MNAEHQQRALQLASEAVIYSYPLYEMSRMRASTLSRKHCTGAIAPDGMRWSNSFGHSRKLIEAGESRVVTPNNDTLYSNAWFDLGDGPLVVDVPDTLGRYYVIGVLDFFTNPFAHLGQRLHGTEAQTFVLVPDGWCGDLPAGLIVVRAPTRWLWIIGRILVDGPHELDAVHALQDQFIVRTLDEWKERRAPAGKLFDASYLPSARPQAVEFIDVVNEALRENGFPEQERAMVQRFADVGIGSMCAPTFEQTASVQAALDAVFPRLRAAQSGTQLDSGWLMPPIFRSHFGDDYLGRAQIAFKYIGMLESEEATYPMAWRDGEGLPLTGSKRYVIRFAPGQLPPVAAFWSMTMYDASDFMLVPNVLHRYAIGDRTLDLQRDADGGVTILVQHERPSGAAASTSNWLPAPRAEFYLCLRAYIPHAELLDGGYALPVIEVVGAASKEQP